MLHSQKSSDSLFRLSKKWYHRQHRYAKPSQDVVEEVGYLEYHHSFHELSDIEEDSRSSPPRTITRDKHWPPPMSVSKMTTRDLGKFCYNTYQHPAREQDPEATCERSRDLVAAKRKIIFNLACLSIPETEELPDVRCYWEPSNSVYGQSPSSTLSQSGGSCNRLRRRKGPFIGKPRRNDEHGSSSQWRQKPKTSTPFKSRWARIRGCSPKYLHRKMSSIPAISGKRKSQSAFMNRKDGLEEPFLVPMKFSSGHRPRSRGLDPEALSWPEIYKTGEDQRHIQNSIERHLDERTNFGNMEERTRIQNIRRCMHLIDFAVRLQALRLLECINNKMPCWKPDHPSNK